MPSSTYHHQYLTLFYKHYLWILNIWYCWKLLLNTFSSITNFCKITLQKIALDMILAIINHLNFNRFSIMWMWIVEIAQDQEDLSAPTNHSLSGSIYQYLWFHVPWCIWWQTNHSNHQGLFNRMEYKIFWMSASYFMVHPL